MCGAHGCRCVLLDLPDDPWNSVVDAVMLLVLLFFVAELILRPSLPASPRCVRERALHQLWPSPGKRPPPVVRVLTATLWDDQPVAARRAGVLTADRECVSALRWAGPFRRVSGHGTDQARAFGQRRWSGNRGARWVVFLHRVGWGKARLSRLPIPGFGPAAVAVRAL